MRQVWISIFNEYAMSDSAFSFNTPSLNQQFQIIRHIWLSIFNEYAKSEWTFLMKTPQSDSGYSIKYWVRLRILMTNEYTESIMNICTNNCTWGAQRVNKVNPWMPLKGRSNQKSTWGDSTELLLQLLGN